MSKRSRDCHSWQRHERISRCRQTLGAVDFFNVLTSDELLEVTDALMPEHRERCYPPTVTLSMFLRQALEADGSCQKAVDGWTTAQVGHGLRPNSADTGAYCRARQRLPLSMIQGLSDHVSEQLTRRSSRSWRWRGRSVKVVDGTTLSMPDTAQNRLEYPHHGNQAEGVGFPMARLVAVTCLATGAVLTATHGAFKGKHSGEASLLRRLLPGLSAGDVVLADSLYASYFLIAELQRRGLDGVFEQHSARITDFRRGRQLGPRDHCVRWRKPRARPAWMTLEQYQAAPRSLAVREVRVNGRTLVTTLPDVPKNELGELYARRWDVELTLRDIKATMGMAVLRCKSPDMVAREIWTHLLAYNLIRLLMAQAARCHGLHPRELSFKHSLQTWIRWLDVGLTHCNEHALQALLGLIARKRVRQRPGRVEPRARKRRPKSYPRLQVPRHQARQRLIDANAARKA